MNWGGSDVDAAKSNSAVSPAASVRRTADPNSDSRLKPNPLVSYPSLPGHMAYDQQASSSTTSLQSILSSIASHDEKSRREVKFDVELLMARPFSDSFLSCVTLALASCCKSVNV